MGDPRRGGWKTFPFIAACSFAVGTASTGSMANMTVYLKQQFNVDLIDATVFSGIFGGAGTISPVFGAVVADACLDCFTVMSASAAVSFLGMLLITLTAAIPSLSPPPCAVGECTAATKGQLAVLYVAASLMVVGLGGTRFVGATMGAVQFDSDSDRSSFFNWYIVGMYAAAVAGIVGIVYVQTDAGWIWGFGLCAALSGAGLLVFLFGRHYYRSILERPKNPSSSPSQCSYYSRLEDGESESKTQSLRSSERAAAEFRTILKLVPLLSASIFMSVSMWAQGSMTVLQALAMDRCVILGRDFSIPAATMPVFVVVPALVFIPLLNRTIYPAWHWVARQSPTPLQRIGSGLLVASVGMACAASTESKRLAESVSSGEPVSVFWLLPALLLVGLGDSMMLPAQLEFFYQEFPESLRSSATGVNALISGTGAYTGTAIIALVRRFTGWLKDGADQSRLDNVYWLLAVMGVLNFCYFLVCAKLYKGRELV